ncbi:MAG: outer membrane protein assembly factor BamA [Planctomycetota bacterium]
MRILLAFGVLVALLNGKLRAQESEPATAQKMVVRIRFEGNRRYTDEFLQEQIATKEGQPYDPGLIAQDERVLRRFFAAVTDKVEREVEGGIEIVFHVLDKVVVGKVLYRGLARVRKKDFEDLMSTRAGRPLLEHSLESDRRLLERLHRAKGYRFVAVHFYRQPTKKADVEDIVFQVITGRRVKVKEVILEGARSLDRSDLLKIIKNSDRYRKTYLGLGKLLNPSYYDRAAIDEDRRKMEMYYEREGFLDAKVIYVDTRFDEKRRHAIIKYRVEEGQRYRIRSFTVTYAKDGRPREADRRFLAPRVLEGLSVLVPGEPFRYQDLNATQRQIGSRLWERAYARSRIEVRFTTDTEKHTVDIKLVITAGPKVRLGRIRIFGNKWTRDNVIRRQFRNGALPGDYLDIEALEAARNRLMSLRYFSLVRFGTSPGTWGLSRDPNAPGEDVYDVELEVEETDTRQFQIGAGISTDGGASGQVSVTWRNFDIRRPPDKWWQIFAREAFRGGGQRLTVSAAPGTTFSRFAISFADPAVRDSRWSLSTSVARRIALFDTYDQITDGIWIRVGRYLDESFVWSLTFSWTLRQEAIEDPEPNAPVIALDDQGTSTLHGLGVTLMRRRIREADVFLNGHITTLGSEVYGGVLGGHVDIFKINFEHRAGWRLFRTRRGGWHRFRAVFRTNWGTAFGDASEVPIYERYFLGGRSLRGFEWREVGPRSNGSPEGGEFLVTLSLQYTVPLTTREDAGFGFDLIFFVDQGGLTGEFHDFTEDDWRVSTGFGFAIGFGGLTQPPLLLDFGWPLRRQGPDRLQVISIAFERNF